MDATRRTEMTRKKSTNLTRRRLIGSMIYGTVGAGIAMPTFATGATFAMDVWKSPTCGCCKDWVSHLEANGFAVTTHDNGNTQARDRLGMPVKFGSCHTGEVEGYAIEGHVPAVDIHRLLSERPDAIGLSVPAMPRGSPGMDGPAYGGVKDPYDVLLVGHDGEAQVYRSYRD
jgi:hypothetical protein